jgi:hypothetical protein
MNRKVADAPKPLWRRRDAKSAKEGLCLNATQYVIFFFASLAPLR